MSTPKLTIVLPIYNVAKFIERCLVSIYSNEFDESDIELVLVDDASPDNSIEIALEWLKQNNHSNFKLIRQENKGLGGARNTGLFAASAPWLWFIDTDDRIAQNAIPLILERLDSTQDFITFNALVLPQNELIYPDIKHPVTNADAEVITSQHVINSPCFNIYRIQFLKDNKLEFREKLLHEDNEFSIRVNYFANKISIYPEPIYFYYTHNGSSITHSFSQKRVDDLLAHFDTYDRLCSLRPNKTQLKAMQLINTVAFYWLWNLRSSALGKDNQVLDKLFKDNQWRFMAAFSVLPLKKRISIYLLTTSWYPKLKKRLHK